jgi:hypothetical protein
LEGNIHDISGTVGRKHCMTSSEPVGKETLLNILMNSWKET